MGSGNDNAAAYNANGMYTGNSYGGGGNSIYDSGYDGGGNNIYNSGYDGAGNGMQGSMNLTHTDDNSPQEGKLKSRIFLIGALVLAIVLMVFIFPKMNAKRKYKPIVHDVVDTLVNDSMEAVYSKYGFVAYNKVSETSIRQSINAEGLLTVDTKIKSISELFGEERTEVLASMTLSTASDGTLGSSIGKIASIDKVIRVKAEVELSQGGQKVQTYLKIIQIDFVKVKGKSDLKVVQISY